MRYHSPPGFPVAQRENRICRPANLERARLLQVFTLEKQFSARQSVKGRARKDQRAMNSWPNAFVRFDNGVPLNRAGFEFFTQVRDRGASKFIPSPPLG